MARSFDGIDDCVRAPGFAAASAAGLSQCDVFAWFKYSTVGTAKRDIYCEGNVVFEINVNDGTSGRVGVRCNSTSVNFGHAGSYNDGNWHLARYKRVGLSEHYLYVDDMDTPVASSVSAATTANITAKTVGRNGSNSTNFFQGDIADVVIYTGNVSDADALELAAQTKHFGQVSIANLRSWISNGTTQVGLDHAHTPGTTFLGDALGNPTLVNGPHGSTSPVGLTASTDLKNAWVWDYPVTLFTADSGKHFRELGNIIDLGSGESPRYVWFLSEVNGPLAGDYGGSNVNVVLYTSNDLSTWTRHSLLTDVAAEDPYAFRDANGGWHLYAENKATGNNTNQLAYWTSSDGLTWTYVGNKSVTGVPVGSDAASPIAWHEDGGYHMIYEPAGANTIHRATAPAPEGPWTDQGEIIDRSLSWTTSQAVPDDVVKIAGNYYLSVHGNASANKAAAGIFESSDLVTWTQYRTHYRQEGLVVQDRYGHSLQYLQSAGQFGKVFGLDATGMTTVVSIQLFGDPAEQTEAWPSETGLPPGTVYSNTVTTTTLTLPAGEGVISGVASVEGVGRTVNRGSGEISAATGIEGTGFVVAKGSGEIAATTGIEGAGYIVAGGRGELSALATLFGVGNAPGEKPSGSGSISGVITLTGVGFAPYPSLHLHAAGYDIISSGVFGIPGNKPPEAEFQVTLAIHNHPPEATKVLTVTSVTITNKVNCVVVESGAGPVTGEYAIDEIRQLMLGVTPTAEGAFSFRVNIDSDDPDGLLMATFQGTSAVVMAVWPDPSEVLEGVTYGPTGVEYVGTLVGGGAEPLPPGTIVSPAAILAQYLIDELVLSSPSNDPLLEWPVFVNGMPATDSFIRPGQRLVAEIVGSYDTAGVVNSKDMMGKVWEHEGVTMLVRTIEPALGFAKASQIRDALAPVAGTEVTLEGETWKVLNVTRTTGIAAMGQDPETREDLFSLNFRVSLRRVV